MKHGGEYYKKVIETVSKPEWPPGDVAQALLAAESRCRELQQQIHLVVSDAGKGLLAELDALKKIHAERCELLDYKDDMIDTLHSKLAEKTAALDVAIRSINRRIKSDEACQNVCDEDLMEALSRPAITRAIREREAMEKCIDAAKVFQWPDGGFIHRYDCNAVGKTTCQCGARDLTKALAELKAVRDT